MKHIFVALSTFAKEGPAPLKLLQDSGVSFSINPTGKRLTAQETVSMAKEADGIIAGLEIYDEAVLAQLPHLTCISRCGVGVDNVDLPRAKARGITVLNTPQVVIQPVAELTLAMIFDLLRRVTEHTQLLRAHRWERITGGQLAGKTVGILGLGRIGRRVAELLRRLEAKVIGFDVAPDALWAKEKDVRLAGLEEVLASSDILSLHLAFDPKAPFFLSAKEFALMKKGSFLVNVARGSLVDEEALYRALVDGQLAGAGLDVFTKEPYEGPLSGLPNVVMTPHVATLTLEARLQMETEAVSNILAYGGMKR